MVYAREETPVKREPTRGTYENSDRCAGTEKKELFFTRGVGGGGGRSIRRRRRVWSVPGPIETGRARVDLRAAFCLVRKCSRRRRCTTLAGHDNGHDTTPCVNAIYYRTII